MKKISFFKYHGRGNDFILIVDRNNSVELTKDEIYFLCDRNFGIGADGIVLLQSSKSSDFFIKIFNSDGLEANSCGNALFCVGKFVQDQKISQKNQITIELKKSKALVKLFLDHLLLTMSLPKFISRSIILKIGDNRFIIDWIDSGVDHAVTFVSKIDDINIEEEGKKIRGHQKFSPNGVNVNFACPLKRDIFFVRTYERGVEKETLSCVTGAIATAYSAWKKYKIKDIITIKNKQGQVMISFDDNKKNVYIKGEAKYVFEGKVLI